MFRSVSCSCSCLLRLAAVLCAEVTAIRLGPGTTLVFAGDTLSVSKGFSSRNRSKFCLPVGLWSLLLRDLYLLMMSRTFFHSCWSDKCLKSTPREVRIVWMLGDLSTLLLNKSICYFLWKGDFLEQLRVQQMLSPDPIFSQMWTNISAWMQSSTFAERKGCRSVVSSCFPSLRAPSTSFFSEKPCNGLPRTTLLNRSSILDHVTLHLCRRYSSCKSSL